MKKVISILLFVLVACVLSGCGVVYRAAVEIRDGLLESSHTTIQMGTKYLLDRREPYEVEYTETGADVTIHFLIKDEQE